MMVYRNIAIELLYEDEEVRQIMERRQEMVNMFREQDFGGKKLKRQLVRG